MARSSSSKQNHDVSSVRNGHTQNIQLHPAEIGWNWLLDAVLQQGADLCPGDAVTSYVVVSHSTALQRLLYQVDFSNLEK